MTKTRKGLEDPTVFIFDQTGCVVIDPTEYRLINLNYVVGYELNILGTDTWYWTFYTALRSFRSLSFSSQQEAIMWRESLLRAYDSYKQGHGNRFYYTEIERPVYKKNVVDWRKVADDYEKVDPKAYEASFSDIAQFITSSYVVLEKEKAPDEQV